MVINVGSKTQGRSPRLYAAAASRLGKIAAGRRMAWGLSDHRSARTSFAWGTRIPGPRLNDYASRFRVPPICHLLTREKPNSHPFSQRLSQAFASQYLATQPKREIVPSRPDFRPTICYNLYTCANPDFTAISLVLWQVEIQKYSRLRSTPVPSPLIDGCVLCGVSGITEIGDLTRALKNRST